MANSTSSTQLSSPWLRSTAWLADNLKNVVVLDASFYLAIQQRDARAEYLAGHIPGALFFDIDAVADHSSELPHMLPGPAQFGKMIGALGLADGDTIVVYDGSGLYSAPRVWWTLRIFGAKNVFILDGGLPAWKAEGRALKAGEVKRPPRAFNASMDTRAVAMVADVQLALSDGSAQVVDARSAGRFAGCEPEPRAGLRSGHMPGAFNLPFPELIADGRLASRDKIAAAFNKAGVDTEKPVITSCGSGVTAAILTFALDALGKPAGRLYDGSWTEWGGRPALAVGKA